MNSIWSGTERRSEKPGRRPYDSFFGCPYHGDVHDDINKLEDHKLDKWVFGLFVSTVTVLLILAGSVFSYVALEALSNSRHIAVIQVNQTRLMKHFDIPAVEDADTAEKILKGSKKVE